MVIVAFSRCKTDFSNFFPQIVGFWVQCKYRSLLQNSFRLWCSHICAEKGR